MHARKVVGSFSEITLDFYYCYECITKNSAYDQDQ